MKSRSTTKIEKCDRCKQKIEGGPIYYNDKMLCYDCVVKIVDEKVIKGVADT